MAGLFDLTGKVALITGSTRGIGRAIAEAMKAAGAKIFVSNESPQETAAAAGAFITGHNLVVDGGTVITDGS